MNYRLKIQYCGIYSWKSTCLLKDVEILWPIGLLPGSVHGYISTVTVD